MSLEIDFKAAVKVTEIGATYKQDLRYCHNTQVVRDATSLNLKHFRMLQKVHFRNLSQIIVVNLNTFSY